MKTKTFSNGDDFRHFIDLLDSKDIKYIAAHHRAHDDVFNFYSFAHSLIYGEDPKIEHILQGKIIAHDENRMLTNKDEIVQAAYRILQAQYYYFYTIPGVTKLYEFLTGDSIDKTKNYKIPEQCCLVLSFIPEEERWFDIIYRKGWTYLKCKFSKSSKYITIDPLKL